MRMRRRNFIGCIGALPLVGVGTAFADEKPLLRIGVLTDTHVGRTKSTCGRVRQAHDLFRRHSVEMIVNVGDVADYHFPTGYAAYRKTVEEAYAGVPAAERPKELFVYAAHDYFNYRGNSRKEWAQHATEAYAQMQRHIGAENGPYAQGSIKGFPYVVLPQVMTGGVDFAKCEKMIADAVTANPGKPVFVFAHEPPAGTTRCGTGHPKKRAIFNKYPQVVNISGHTHGTLAEERAIWQGEFTSVNVGCLQKWGSGRSGAVGYSSPAMQNYGVLIVDVYSSRIVFRRFDVRDGAEYRAENPWMIPWPFDPASAPYSLKNRKDMYTVPRFAEGAALSVMDSKMESGGVQLTVPATSGEPRPFVYRVRMDRLDDEGKWSVHTRRDFIGDVWQREHERPAKYEQEFPSAYFEPGRKYRFRVAPVNFWGREGEVIEVEFAAPECNFKSEVVWESSNPMDECPILSNVTQKTLQPRDGKFCKLDNHYAWFVFPKGVWDGEQGTRFRLVADIHTIQKREPTWTLVLVNAQPWKYGSGRVCTPGGDSGTFRYVMDLSKKEASHVYHLLIREGGEGKLRIERIRLERLPPA